MCKKLFKAIKIKMDNFKLRYELAGADEEILKLRNEINIKNSEIQKWKEHKKTDSKTIQELQREIDRLKMEFLNNNKNELMEKYAEDIKQIATDGQYYLKELEIYKKALRLACRDIWALSVWENSQEEVIESNFNFYIDKAKEIIEANNQLKIIEKEQLKDE